jgi:hypothetical protein
MLWLYCGALAIELRRRWPPAYRDLFSTVLAKAGIEGDSRGGRGVSAP